VYDTAALSKVQSPASQPQQVLVSIIIPTFNEVANIRRQAAALAPLPEAEVIFVDGGSSDGTPQELRACCAHAPLRFIHARQRRSSQMNAAARIAKGEWLIFLHADTSLPCASFQHFLQYAKSRRELNAGAFTFRVAHERAVYRYLEFYVGLRSRLLKLPYGDQALFVRRRLFEEIGGYREDYPLMEDVELVRRLHQHKGFEILPAPVYTSARRFESEGYLKRTCGNLYLQMLYALGVPPQKLAQHYWR